MEFFNIQAIWIESFPTTADELHQFIHCCKRRSATILDFHRILQTLDEVLQSAYASVGKRQKTAVRQIALSKLCLSAEHEEPFLQVKENSENSMRLAHLKDNHINVAFNNASEKLWARPEKQLEECDTEKAYNIKIINRWRFWAVIFPKCKKDGKLSKMKVSPNSKCSEKGTTYSEDQSRVGIFMDHKAILHVSDPFALWPRSPRHVLAIMNFCTIHLLRFNFVI